MNEFPTGPTPRSWNRERYRLCFVDKPWAFFTDGSFEKIRADDWDDSPYEHNASRPYDVEDGEVFRVGYLGNLRTPDSGIQTPEFTAEDITLKQIIPWLRSPGYVDADDHINIFAGTSLPEFIEMITAIDGDVFLPLEMVQ